MSRISTLLVFVLCVSVLIASTGCARPSARYDLGRSLYEQGRYETALRHFRDAREADPSIPGIDDRIRLTEVRLYIDHGDQALASGRWSAARSAYEEARRRDPRNSEVAERIANVAVARANSHFRRGRNLASKGNPFDAVRELELALEFHRDHVRAAEALERTLREKDEREACAQKVFAASRRPELSDRDTVVIEMLERVIDLNPRHGEAQRELRDVRARLADEWVAKGDDAMRRREWAQARSFYVAAKNHDPSRLHLDFEISNATREECAGP